MADPLTTPILRTVENKPGVVYDAAKTKVMFAEDFNTIGDALDNHEERIVDLEGSPGGLTKATGAEVDAGTDDAKYVTPKAIADSGIAFTSDIPSVPVKATGAEVDAGTDDAKFATPKAIEDSSYTKNALPLAGGTMTGDIVQGENSALQLDDALSEDGKYCGIVENGTAGATLAFGDLCYFNNDDSRWELVDANLSDGYDKKLGICVLAAANDGSATKMLLYGKIRADSAFPTLTIGAPVYMSETAGDIVVAQPTTADVCIRNIGFGNTADELYFCPSPDYIVHV